MKIVYLMNLFFSFLVVYLNQTLIEVFRTISFLI